MGGDAIVSQASLIPLFYLEVPVKEIQYPLTVQKLTLAGTEPIRPKLLFGGKCGDMVAVRPCAPSYEGKTFLGVLIGDVAVGLSGSFNEASGELTIRTGPYNPAILIPDRNVLVYGYESWWGQIRDETQLREITDGDIANVWYVKALQQLQTAEAEDVD